MKAVAAERIVATIEQQVLQATDARRPLARKALLMAIGLLRASYPQIGNSTVDAVAEKSRPAW